MPQSLSAAWYRQTNTDKSTSGVVLAASAGLTDAIVVPSANHTLYIQLIAVNIHTAAAQTITFRDDAGTPIIVLFIEASAAAGTIRIIDFGAKGFALTEGKNFDIAGTAGPAYSFSIEAYAKQTVPTAAFSRAQTVP